MCVAISLVGSAAAAQVDDVRATVRVEAPSCAVSWFDAAAFARALSVELIADGVRVDPSGTTLLSLDVPCAEDAEAVVTLTMGGESETVSLVDMPPRVRMRTLALASRDLIGAALAQAEAARAEPEQALVEVAPSEEHPVEHLARGLASPRGSRDPQQASSVESPPARWFSLSIAARGLWLGLRVVAPSLSIEGEARVLGTPLALWLAIDGLYAAGQDGLGEVRAWSLGARLGARVLLELSPVTVSLSLGVLTGYARADGASSGLGTRVGGVEGALVGLDFSLTGAVSVSDDVRLLLAIGGVGYLVGFEARAEDRPVISFRDVAPWASVGVGVALP